MPKPTDRPATCVELLQRMVGFDTVNSRISGKPDAELALAEYMDALAGELGFETTRLPVSGRGFDLLVSFEVDSAAPWIVFESHLDTVSVADMTIEPFGGEIRDGRIWGRGACDTKGTGASMFWALTRYRDGAAARDGAARPNNIALLYTLDEEIGKDGITAFAERHLETLDWRPMGLVVGEPTRLELVVAHNGVQRWSIETRGVAAHSCDPSRGRSAISAMVKVVAALESGYIAPLDFSHPLTGRAQSSINLIEGGVQSNIIPERCRIVLDRRVVPGEDPEAIQPAIEGALEVATADSEALDVSLEKYLDSPPLDPAVGAEFASFVASALAAHGLDATGRGVPYATDAGEASAHGLPCVVFGPGDIAQAHTRDEWLDLAELERGVEAYLAIMRFGGGSD